MAKITFFAYHLKSLLNTFERLVLNMHHISRKERLENKLYQYAENGNFQLQNFTLYKSEIRKYRKQGFTVIPSMDSDKPVPCIIEWKHPFPKTVPLIVYNYITNQINTFPKVQNWAQHLYVIAARANYIKGTNN